MKYLGLIIAFALFFFSGSIWQKWQLLESGPVELIKPLTLQAAPEAIGQIKGDATL